MTINATPHIKLDDHESKILEEASSILYQLYNAKMAHFTLANCTDNDACTVEIQDYDIQKANALCSLLANRKMWFFKN